MLQKNNIIKQFLEKPTERFQLRELARLTKLSTTAVKSRLKQLISENIVQTKKEKKYTFYLANKDSQEYKWTKRFFNIEKILASGILEHLDEQLNYPEAVILFGSVSRGEDTERSDIDLFILSENKADLNLGQYEAKTGKPIRVQLFSRAEFESAKRKSKELINNVLNGIILKGYVEAI